MILYRVEVHFPDSPQQWHGTWFSTIGEAKAFYRSRSLSSEVHLDRVYLEPVARESIVELLNLADANRDNLPGELIQRRAAEFYGGGEVCHGSV